MGERTKAVTLALAIGLFTILLTMSLGFDLRDHSHAAGSAVLGFSSHSSIRIDSDSELSALASQEGWSGDGGSTAPYIVEGLEIGPGDFADCLYVGNVSYHFIIRDCYIHSDSESGSHMGIHIYNTTNASITGNTCSGNWNGIYLRNSTNAVILGNNCSSNKDSGIWIDSTSNSTIADNVLSFNFCGLELVSARDVLVSNNTIFMNQDGVRLSAANENSFTLNAVYDSTESGFLIFGGENNQIWNNSFARNVGQASDTGGNFWNSYYNKTGGPTDLRDRNNLTGFGNYWDNWVKPDKNKDGIVDKPYTVDPNSATDYFPLSQPTRTIPPEHEQMDYFSLAVIIAVIAVAGAVAAVLGSRRMRRPRP